MIDPASAAYRDLIRGLKASRRPTAADLAEAMKIAANGKALLRIGDRYSAMGDYAKAVELYKLAMGKPDGDRAVANLHIGMALAAVGRQSRRNGRAQCCYRPARRDRQILADLSRPKGLIRTGA